VGVRRDAANQECADIGFEWIGGLERLDELVGVSDFVIVSAPLTPQTSRLFDARRFARFKPGASIVNVGRGGVIDEPALLSALDNGRLHAAGLDTLKAEPPPPNSRLLSHPRVVLTPHDAGVSEVAFDGVVRILADNAARLERSQPLNFRIV
jgi:phosphoglycerate dehydrogenase-like enzyme